MSQLRKTTNRIPVTPEIHEELKEFRNGLNVSFDEAIALLLLIAKEPKEDTYAAGKRLRSRLSEIEPKE